MADISQVKLPNGDTYNLVDETSGYITTSIYSGTCASEAADTTKVVTCADFTELKAGAAILVTFSTTNSAAVADLMMNVNGTGAKKIQYINNGTRGNLSSAGYLKASTTYLFVYDGTYWVVYFNYNTTYSSMTDAEITAGTGTTARTITPARLKTAVETWAPEETDPIFSASAAAGITSTDISNWNGKVNNVKVDGVSVVTNGTAEIDLSNIKTFIVNISENNGTYTSDKTAKEICEAHNAGRVVILKPAGSYVLLSSVYTEGNYYQADFYESEASSNSFNLYQYMIVTNNNTTTVDYSYYNTSVNNAYLTIQKNGTTVESFSANASANKIANIIVPTKTSDLTNDSGFLTLSTLPIYDGTVV